MKKIMFVLALASFALSAFEMEYIIPTPREMTHSGTASFKGGTFKFIDKFSVPPVHAEHIKQEMKRFFNLSPADKSPVVLEIRKVAGNGNKEFYTLLVSSGKIVIGAADIAGVYRASGRLFGIAEQLRIVPGKDGVKMPALSIRDWPEYKFRGFHFQIGGAYSERRFRNVIGLVDRLNRFGLNAMIFELGGRINCPASPELTRQPAWPDARIKELINFCRARGLKAYPAFNGPGHIAAAPRIYPLPGVIDHGNGARPKKELIMDISHPQFWKKYMTYLDRVIEVFEHPDFIAIGTDEFRHGAKTLEERTGLPQNVYYPAYLKKVTDYLKKKNIRCGAWHDMMVDRQKYLITSHYSGYAVNGVAGTLEKVPEDCIIMYWFYGHRTYNRVLEDIRKAKPRNEIWVVTHKDPQGAESLFRLGRKMGSNHALGSLWGYAWHRVAVPAVSEFSWNTANVRKLDTPFFEKCNDRFYFQRPAGAAVPAKAQLLKAPFTPADAAPREVPLPWKADELVKKKLLVSTDNTFEMSRAQGVYKDQARTKSGMWIYTPSYGKSTGTNMYGEEYAVVNGVITEVYGSPLENKKGNMNIPGDGMVFSLRGMFNKKFPRTLGLMHQLRVGKKFRLYEVPVVKELKRHSFAVPAGTRTVTLRMTVKRPLIRKEKLLKVTAVDSKKKRYSYTLQGMNFITTRPGGAWSIFLVSAGLRPVIDVECQLPNDIRRLIVVPTEAGAMVGVTINSIECR